MLRRKPRKSPGTSRINYIGKKPIFPFRGKTIFQIGQKEAATPLSAERFLKLPDDSGKNVESALHGFLRGHINARNLEAFDGIARAAGAQEREVIVPLAHAAFDDAFCEGIMVLPMRRLLTNFQNIKKLCLTEIIEIITDSLYWKRIQL